MEIDILKLKADRAAAMQAEDRLRQVLNVVMDERDEAIKERGELAKAFVEVYDALWAGEDNRHWGLDNDALHALREKLDKEASGE